MPHFKTIGPIPPSGLGPDGKLRVMTEEEHRQYIESALCRIDEIEQIADDRMILPKRSGCGRSTNSVLIGPRSKDVTESCGKVLGDVPELRGEVLVHEQNVHFSECPASRTSTSWQLTGRRW